MTPHVVDTSVVIKWFADEVHAEAVRRLQEDQYELFAPDILWPEGRNILWEKVRRGELTTDEARLSWSDLEQQPISAYPCRLVLELTLEVAFDTNHTVYDSCYLALARLIGCHLVTARRSYEAELPMSHRFRLRKNAVLPSRPNRVDFGLVGHRRRSGSGTSDSSHWR